MHGYDHGCTKLNTRATLSTCEVRAGNARRTETSYKQGMGNK